MDHTVLISLIGAAAVIIPSYFASRTTLAVARLNASQIERAKEIKEATETVRNTLQTSNLQAEKERAQLKIVMDKTHDAVNGSMGHQLKMHAEMAEELAALRNTPEAWEKAKAARALYDAHEASIEKNRRETDKQE